MPLNCMRCRAWNSEPLSNVFYFTAGETMIIPKLVRQPSWDNFCIEPFARVLRVRNVVRVQNLATTITACMLTLARAHEPDESNL